MATESRNLPATIDGDPGERIAVVAGALIVVNAPFQGDGGPARDANLANAFAVAILPNGDLVVSDTDLGRIRLVTTGGDGVVDGVGDERISTIAGFSTNSNEPPVFEVWTSNSIRAPAVTFSFSVPDATQRTRQP